MQTNKPKKPLIFLILKIVGAFLFVAGVITALTAIGVNNDTVALAVRIGVGAILVMFGVSICFSGFYIELRKLHVQTQNYIINNNKEDLTQIVETGADITSAGINRVADKSSGAITKTVGAIKRGITEDADPQKYCKHCGAQIDADALFCEKCGKKQD